MNKVSTSYLLWLCWFLGFSGLHRIYNKKFVTGLLWFFTWGLFGLGQFIDLLLIPSMVDEHNIKVRRRLGLSSQGIPLNDSSFSTRVTDLPESSFPHNFTQASALTQEQIMIKLAQAAKGRGGKISVTQAVVDIGITFDEVQNTLNEMVKKGYVAIDNHPSSGVVIYDFLEL